MSYLECWCLMCAPWDPIPQFQKKKENTENEMEHTKRLRFYYLFSFQQFLLFSALSLSFLKELNYNF